jgi:hypothetical protein
VEARRMGFSPCGSLLTPRHGGTKGNGTEKWFGLCGFVASCETLPLQAQSSIVNMSLRAKRGNRQSSIQSPLTPAPDPCLADNRLLTTDYCFQDSSLHFCRRGSTMRP